MTSARIIGGPTNVTGALWGANVLSLAGVARAQRGAVYRGLSRAKSHLAILTREITPQKAPPYNPQLLAAPFGGHGANVSGVPKLHTVLASEGMLCRSMVKGVEFGVDNTKWKYDPQEIQNNFAT